MKPILYLGILAVCAMSTQVYLETSNANRIPTSREESEIEPTRFKIEDGKIFFLTNESEWVEKDNYIWKADNGLYYKHINGKLFTSADGERWQLVANLLKTDANTLNRP